MLTLFDEQAIYPRGFSYTESFISEKEELQLISVIEKLHLTNFIFRGYEARRRVASYGYDYHFTTRSITKGLPVPEGFSFLTERVAEYLKIPPSEIQEVLVTEYPAGSVINWHRDAPPFDWIVGVSLLSDCKFRLRPYKPSSVYNNSKTKKQGIAVHVRRRSLYLMKDEAREEWEHSIDKVKEKRYSITLRTLRKK